MKFIRTTNHLKRKHDRAERNNLDCDISKIEARVEFHKNGVLTKIEYLKGLIDDCFKLMVKG